MYTRVLLALAMIAPLLQSGATLRAQAPQPSTTVQAPADDLADARSATDLLQRLDRIARAGSAEGYLSLLTPAANRERAAAFAADVFRAPATRVVLQERDRVRITRSAASAVAFRIVIDMFAEEG